MIYYYNFHDIIRLRSDIDFGMSYFQCEDLDNDPDLIVTKVDYRPVDKTKYHRIAPNLYYSTDKQSIVSNMNILGLRVSWELKNILLPRTELRVSQSYIWLSKHITFPIASVYKLITWIRMVMQIKLLLKGHTFIVGGCVQCDKRNVAFCGLVGSGKTLTTVNFMDKYNTKYISDDVFIIGKDRLFSYPSILKLRKLNFDFGSFSDYIAPEKKFGPKIINQSDNGCDVYFLELSASRFIQKIALTEGITKLSNLNNKIFLGSNERILTSLSYIYNDLSLSSLLERQRSIMDAFFNGSSFYVVSSQDVKDYAGLIANNIGLE